MYLERLRLQHVKLIDDLELSFLNTADFTDEHGREHKAGDPRMWTVLISRNGRGKSTVLQSIALCACGSGTVNNFGIAQHFLPKHRPDSTGRAEADFRLGPPLPFSSNRSAVRYIPKTRAVPGLLGDKHHLRLMSHVQVAPGGSLFDAASSLHKLDGSIVQDEAADPLKAARSTNLPRWFTAAYGVARNLSITTSVPSFSHPPTERLKPLFQSDQQLIGLGFADYFQGKEKTKFTKMLNSVIKATEDLFPEIQELNLRGRGSIRTADDFLDKEKVKMVLPGGVELNLPTTFLSHGYQSSLAWVADMIGQFLLDDPALKAAEHLSGLVLIDELDLHLHPTWQATFISALRKTFPRVQFVATTHSPLVLSSLRPEEIVILELEDGGITARTGAEVRDPRLRTVGELASEFFEIDKLYPQGLGAKLDEYSRIAANRYRSAAEEERASSLRAELIAQGVTPGDLLPKDATPRLPMSEWPDGGD